MNLLVVTLLLAHPLTGAVTSARDDAQTEARVTRERCLGSGAAGAVGALLGLAVGGGMALGLGEIVKASDPANTSASRSFDSFAVPFGAAAGAVTGLAIGTIGAWELTDELAGKPAVTR